MKFHQAYEEIDRLEKESLSMGLFKSQCKYDKIYKKFYFQKEYDSAKINELNTQIDDYRKKICDLVKQREEIQSKSNCELPYKPIEVAQMLITAEGKYVKQLYDIPKLKQITEHLLVYCNNNQDGD